jgi:hypothetical protein
LADQAKQERHRQVILASKLRRSWRRHDNMTGERFGVSKPLSCSEPNRFDWPFLAGWDAHA